MSIIHQLLDTYGYTAVAVGVGVESVGIPLPGETVLIAAATYAGATGDLSTPIVVLIAAMAGIVGDNIGFLIGRRFGDRLLGYLDLRLGRRARHLHDVERLFDRNSGRVVLFGRFVSVVRTYIAFSAGARFMPWRRFLTLNTTGVVAWAAVVGFGSAALGSTLGTWGTYGLTAGTAVLVAVAAAHQRHSDVRRPSNR
jgi:membrane protein DedA with SNARE-associated domain